MSQLMDDKKPLEGKRETLPEEVKVSLRDQIVKKLFKKLEELKIGQKVTEMWQVESARHSLRDERQRAWLASWDEHLVADNEGAFDGSSQLHIPMPYIVCKTLHARYLQAIWQDPPFNVKAENETSIDAVSLVRDVMRWYLLRGANYNKGVGKIIDSWVWDWITQGSAVLKLRWDVLYSRFLDVETVQKPGQPRAISGPDGNVQLLPTTVEVEQEVERVKKIFEGPCLDLVDIENIQIIGGGGDPDCADAVLELVYKTASELWTLVDMGIFDEDAVREILQGGSDLVSGEPSQSIKQDRSMNAGTGTLDTETDLDRYAILEGYLKVPVDQSGINSDVIVWVHKKSGKLLRATYLQRVSPKGYRPYAKADFQPRKGQERAVGMPELLYPLSKEMDTHHNLRIDWGLISVMPFGFYRPSSGIDPEVIQFEPGSLIPVDNPQTDVYFPNLGNRTSFGFQEETALQNMVERLTSISDLNLGMMGSQGAARTATGARALVGEMSSNLDVFLRRLNWGWEKALKGLLDLLQQRIPPGLAFRLTGDGGNSEIFRKLNSAKDIYGDFDIEVSPNSSSSNNQMQEEKASDILQMTLNQLLIQTGVVTVANIYNAAENYYRAKGIKDFGKFLTKPQGPLRVLTPEEETNRLLNGQEVPVTPEMDHQGYIDFYQHFHDTDELMGQYSLPQIGLLKIQAVKHQQMLEALQKQQAQTANLRQQQMNAQASPSVGSSQQPTSQEIGGTMSGGNNKDTS